jgi:hypothetical protein
VVSDGKPCSTCAEDIELEQEIKELEKCIEKIHIKRCALRPVMNKNHDHLIHKFPPEISSQIFIQYAKALKFGPRNREELLYLGAVCQNWRQLAWATPDLWTSVVVCQRDITEWSDHTEQLFSGWLKRSASLPLTVSLSVIGRPDLGQGNDVYGRSEYLEQALGTVAPPPLRDTSALPTSFLWFLRGEYSPHTRYLSTQLYG